MGRGGGKGAPAHRGVSETSKLLSPILLTTPAMTGYFSNIFLIIEISSYRGVHREVWTVLVIFHS